MKIKLETLREMYDILAEYEVKDVNFAIFNGTYSHSANLWVYGDTSDGNLLSLTASDEQIVIKKETVTTKILNKGDK